MRALARPPRAASPPPNLPRDPGRGPSLLPKWIWPIRGSPCVCPSVQPLPFIYFSSVPSRGGGVSAGPSGGFVLRRCHGLSGYSAPCSPAGPHGRILPPPEVFVCLQGSLHLVLDTTACPTASPWLPRGVPTQRLEGLNHPRPLSCLFVRLCPSVRWELEEFRLRHPLPLHCVQNNGPGQQVLNPLPARWRHHGGPRWMLVGAVHSSPRGHSDGCSWDGALPGKGVLGAVDQGLRVPPATSSVGTGTTRCHPACASSLRPGTRRN